MVSAPTGEKELKRDVSNDRIDRLEAAIAGVTLSLLQQGIQVKGTESIKANRLADGQLRELLFPDLTIPPEKPKDPLAEDWEAYQ